MLFWFLLSFIGDVDNENQKKAYGITFTLI